MQGDAMSGRISLLLVMLMLSCLGGCATTSGPGAADSLERALENMRKNDAAAARQHLEQAVTLPAVAGVTDEALFRLALVRLGGNGERSDVAASLLLLQRLRKEYPASIWTAQSEGLRNILALSQKSKRDQTGELRSLRERNSQLQREKRELRETIERLKMLDLELEKKKRRFK